MKGILGDEDRSVVVQIVDELVNGKYALQPVFSPRSSSLTESFGYYDPATGRTMMPSDGGKLSFEDVIVFMVGGGNYSEYQHLQVYAKSQNPARVILYGSTDICSANQVGAEWAVDGSLFPSCRCATRNKREDGLGLGMSGRGMDTNRNVNTNTNTNRSEYYMWIRILNKTASVC